MKMIKNFYLMLSLPLFLGIVAVNNVEAALFRPRNLGGASRIYAGRTSAAMAGIPRQSNEIMVGAGSQLPNRQPYRPFSDTSGKEDRKAVRRREHFVQKIAELEQHLDKLVQKFLESTSKEMQKGGHIGLGYVETAADLVRKDKEGFGTSLPNVVEWNTQDLCKRIRGLTARSKKLRKLTERASRPNNLSELKPDMEILLNKSMEFLEAYLHYQFATHLGKVKISKPLFKNSQKQSSEYLQEKKEQERK